MGLFTGRYEVKVVCINCEKMITIRIPRGTTIKEYLENKKARCGYCGCDTIETLKKLEGFIEKNKDEM